MYFIECVKGNVVTVIEESESEEDMHKIMHERKIFTETVGYVTEKGENGSILCKDAKGNLVATLRIVSNGLARGRVREEK